MSYDVEKWSRRSGARVFGGGVTGYRICTRCIMDTSDPEIEFDAEGVCNHCHDYERRLAAEVYPGVKGRQQLAKFVAQIKREGAGKPAGKSFGTKKPFERAGAADRPAKPRPDAKDTSKRFVPPKGPKR